MSDNIHKHLIIRAEIKKSPRSEDVLSVDGWLKNLIDSISMKILMGPYSTYCDVIGNRGMTAAAIIETSHIVLHTWDECLPAVLQLDVYSCSDFDVASIVEKLEIFYPEKLEYKFLDRSGGLVELSSSSRLQGEYDIQP